MKRSSEECLKCFNELDTSVLNFKNNSISSLTKQAQEAANQSYCSIAAQATCSTLSYVYSQCVALADQTISSKSPTPVTCAAPDTSELVSKVKSLNQEAREYLQQVNILQSSINLNQVKSREALKLSKDAQRQASVVSKTQSTLEEATSQLVAQICSKKSELQALKDKEKQILKLCREKNLYTQDTEKFRTELDRVLMEFEDLYSQKIQLGQVLNSYSHELTKVQAESQTLDKQTQESRESIYLKRKKFSDLQNLIQETQNHIEKVNDSKSQLKVQNQNFKTRFENKWMEYEDLHSRVFEVECLINQNQNH